MHAARRVLAITIRLGRDDAIGLSNILAPVFLPYMRGKASSSEKR